MHVKKRNEEELTRGDNEDRVVVDLRVGRLNPGAGEKSEGAERWESRAGGIWIKRSAKRHDSDSHNAITAVDVLFGADVVEPRPGWEIRDTPLLLNSPGEMQEARLTVRRGKERQTKETKPRIKKDGKFKIMQAADLHLSTGFGKCRDAEPPVHNGGKCDADPRTLDFVGKLLDDEKPDLVVLSGDQVNGDSAPDAQSAIFKFAELFISRKIPYAAIFGNHDDEGSLDRDSQMKILQALPYSLSEPGPTNVEGTGNYVVEILAPSTEHSAITLYLLDTHGYSPDERQFKGYDWLKPNQIEWFKAEAGKRRKNHAEYKKIHLDMSFVHIPLPEYRDQSSPHVGEWRESVTAPGFNSGFLDALVEKGVKVLSCGHDHVNDFCALNKKSEPVNDEIWLCYGGGGGFGGYGGYGGYHRRLRFFEIDTNDARITTWKRLEYGDTGKRLDEQIIVEGGKVVAT